MKGQFIGTRLVLAWAKTRGEYNEYRGWIPPEGEDQSVKGYLIEYLDGGESNDPRHRGFITWTPETEFTGTYRPSGNGVSFSAALEALKAGRRVFRTGWNGKGMYVYRVDQGRYPPITKAGERIAETQHDHKVPYAPYYAIKGADNMVTPWTPTQGDLEVDDWIII
jgi:hypothetical protein